MKLRGNRCQCSGCLEYLNSTSVFARHRIGDWQNRGAHRRCLSVAEMEARGWLKNAAGFWIREKRPSRLVHAERASGDRANPVAMDTPAPLATPPLPADAPERGQSSISPVHP